MERPANNEQRRARTRAAAPLLALLLLAAATGRAAAETYYLDGYEVEVTLRPARPSFVLGERIELMMEFLNRSDTDLELLLSGEQGRGWPDDFEVRVEGPDGKALPRPEPEEDEAGGRRRRGDASYTNSYVSASRNDTANPTLMIVFSLEGWAEIREPGVYAVTLRRGVRAGPRARRYRLFPGTTKPAVEVRLTTQVTIVGEGGLGKLVEELGAKMLACDRTASAEPALRLSAIEDARVVPHFRQALVKCRVPVVRAAAVRALSKFKTDEAFEGLRLAAEDDDDDLRTETANALWTNKHPKARALLLSMRKDPYFGVRMVVLIGLEGMDTEQARRVIQEMTNDEHPLVRAEALRFLQERAGHPPRR